MPTYNGTVQNDDYVCAIVRNNPVRTARLSESISTLNDFGPAFLRTSNQTMFHILLTSTSLHHTPPELNLTPIIHRFFREKGEFLKWM